MNVDSLRNIVNNIDQEACSCTIRTVGNNDKDEDILNSFSDSPYTDRRIDCHYLDELEFYNNKKYDSDQKIIPHNI